MTPEVVLVVARFVHMNCVILLFGGTFFPLYARSASASSKRLERMSRLILSAAALVALLSGLAWFFSTVANMSGTFADALNRETLSSVLWDTDFGRVWAMRLPLMLLVLMATSLRGVSTLSRRLIAFLTILAAMLLASLAGVGHTQVDNGVSSVVHVTSDAVHLLAGGAWLGGLLPLLLFLAPDRGESISRDEAVLVLSRFSGMGYGAVAVLLASGSVNSWFLVGSLSHLIDTTYGQLLSLKLALLGIMLTLAASNRFWLVPAIARSTTANGTGNFLVKLRRHVLAEQMLGLVVVGIVSLLGMLSPAIHGSS